MEKLSIGVFILLVLTTSCGELSTPNTVAEPISVSSASRVIADYYNTPFITVDETLEFHSGMTTSSVLSLCGKPLYVATGDSEKVIWVYQVRELLVRSELGERELVKTSETTTFSSNMHFIALTFEYGQLSVWTSMNVMNGSIDLVQESDTEN